MSQTPRKRCFIAAPVDAECRTALEEIQQKLRQSEAIPGRPIPLDNLHLTLAFLGALDAGQRARVSCLLAGTVTASRATDQPLDRIGAFPGPASRLIALEGGPDPVLAALRRRLLNELAATGLPAVSEDRPFRPHVSLMRLKRPLTTPPLTEAQLTLPVRELVFYESVVDTGGVRYQRLAAFELPE